ncbi:MAG TPA: ABC transporter permease [Saprospiraceae bacterium]|nr:ABC transporter permease [Saprospiraceae bacterium]
MWWMGISRLFWLLTTVWIVSILSFFLSKGAPGDRAEAILSLQGLHPTDGNIDRYYQEYEKVFFSEGLHQPLFYFSIIPSYKNKNIEREWNFQTKQLFDKLLNERYYENDALNWVDNFQMLDSLCTSNGNRRCRQELAFLKVSKSNLQRNQRIMELSSFLDGEKELTKWEEWIAIHQDMQMNKVRGYYPVLKWNGWNNQYHRWVISFFQSKMGTSLVDGRSAGEKIKSALWWTLSIVMISLFLSLMAGIPLGMVIAIKQGSKTDLFISVFLYIIYAMPVFWLATLLVVFFTTSEYGEWTNIFPAPFFRVKANQSFISQFFDHFTMIILPVLCLFLSNLAVIARISQSSLRSEMSKPYRVALRARGLSARRVTLHHLVPNAMIPVITLVSNYIPGALAGSLIIEVIFNIPGMGRLMYDSIFYSDWDVVFAIVLLVSIVTSITLFFADILYAKVNPRIQLNNH